MSKTVLKNDVKLYFTFLIDFMGQSGLNADFDSSNATFDEILCTSTKRHELPSGRPSADPLPERATRSFFSPVKDSGGNPSGGGPTGGPIRTSRWERVGE